MVKSLNTKSRWHTMRGPPTPEQDLFVSVLIGPRFFFRSLFLLSSFLARILSAVLNTVLSTSGKTAPKQPPAPAAAITVCLVGNVWS